MEYRAAVITVSDRCSAGEREDLSGPAVSEMMARAGYEIIYASIIPDDRGLIERELIKCADELCADIVLTTGGTGFSPRDVTPEATRAVIDREAPGIPQAMLIKSLEITPRAMLSRAVCGLRGGALIINLPGSAKAAVENLSAVIDTLEHALRMLGGEGH